MPRGKPTAIALSETERAELERLSRKMSARHPGNPA